MTDTECVALLQWALPQLGLRWQGFRRVRRQVCRRVSRRIAELGLRDTDAYRARLEAAESEWEVLAELCRQFQDEMFVAELRSRRHFAAASS